MGEVQPYRSYSVREHSCPNSGSKNAVDADQRWEENEVPLPTRQTVRQYLLILSHAATGNMMFCRFPGVSCVVVHRTFADALAEC